MSYLTRTVSAAPATPGASKASTWVSNVNLRPHSIDANGLVLSYGPGIACTSAASAAINTAETAVAGGNAINGATCLIPANFLQVGSTIRVTLNGTCTASVANASTFRGRIGAAGTTADASMFTAAVTSAAAGTTIPFQVVITLTVRTVGAAGTIAGTAVIQNQGTTGLSTLTVNVVPLTVSTIITTAQAYLTFTYVSAAATTTCTFQNGIVEIIR